MKYKWWIGAAAVCLVLVTLSPLASSSPDGLERVAEDQGFAGMATRSPLVVMGDYLFPGVHNEALATILAGWLGVVLTFALAYGVAFWIRKRNAGNAR